MFGFRIRNAGGDPLKYVDYEGHLTNGVIKRGDGSYVAMWRVEGLPWETLEEDSLYSRRNEINSLLVNIASERLVIAAHEVRTLADESVYPVGEFITEFARSLDDVYRERLTTGSAPLYWNEQFYSVTLRPPQPMGRTVARLLQSAQLTEEESEADSLKLIEDRLAIIAARLKKYGLRRLEYRYANGQVFSAIAEAMVLIHSGKKMAVAVPDGPIGDALYNKRTRWGPRQSISISEPSGRTRYAAAFGFKVPGTDCPPWIFNHLKSAPFCYSFSRHFHFMSLAAGETTTKNTIKRADIAKDPAVDLIPAMALLRRLLIERRVVMGNHHNVMTVFADSPDELEVIAPEAHAALSNGGASVVREDWADLPAYWSHLPGNVGLWPRPMAVTSANFASFSSLNAYPIGPERGRWGPPATMYRSSGGTPVRQHLHVRDVGNIAVFGPTGMGKTVLVTHLLAQCERYDPPPQVAFFDQYRGADIGIRALGGAYHVLQDGIPTGCNPLKALSPDNPRDMAFLRFLARGMIGGEIDPENQRSIGLSLQMVMELPPEGRSWGEVRAFLGYERGGIGERLDIWCEGNEYGWALDCQEDRMAFDHRLTGYDTTQILTNEVTLGPIQAYLAYRTEAIIDGRRAIVVIDEFHHWLENAFWAKLAASLARTIRRRNGVLIMLTQHPADLAKCPFGHTIMQQTPQQFFAPDRRAKPEEYVGGAQINEPMFDMIKRRMQVGQGQFLRVVDGEAMVIQPPLGGLDAHMAVLSSRDEAVKLAATIRAEHGDQWLGQFMQRHAEAAP